MPKKEGQPIKKSKTGSILYSKVWADTPLGVRKDWPQSLNSAIKMCLSSNSPVSICWGNDLLFLYNDAWIDLLGDKHPSFLGQPAGDIFDHKFNSCLRKVLSTGEVAEITNKLLSFPGGKKSTLNFSFSPIPAENDVVGGVYITAVKHSETQETVGRQIIKEKEDQLAYKIADMKRLYELSLKLQQQDDVSDDTMNEVMVASAELMKADKVSVQIYDKKDDVIRLVSTLGFDSHFEEQFDIIDADDITSCATAMKNQEQVLVEDFGKTDEYPEFGKIARSYGLNAVLSTPLFSSDEQLLGMFSMYWENSHHPAEEKLQLLELYTQQAARQIERQQADQGLRESEAKFRMLAENLNEVIWISSADNERFIYINPAFEKVWGLDREQVYNDPLSFLDVIHPEDRERIRGKYAALPEAAIDEVYRIIRPDGEVRWIHSRAFKIQHGEKQIARVIGISEDITKRKKHERELQKSEKKYRTLFESIDEGFCIIKVLFDEEGSPVNFRYLETNPAYEIHSGLKDVEGKTAHDTVPNLEKEWLQKYGKVALTGEPERFEKYHNEFQRWFSIYAFRLEKPGERKVAVIFSDITDRKENEKSNAYLSAIIENSDDAIISKDLDGNITSWNDSAERIFGYSADEAVGRHITLIIPDDRLDEEDEILSKLRRGDKIDHFETKRQHKDGTLLDISLTISPVRNAEGEIVGASKIARDITERKEAEQKLIKNRNRLRTALEINTVGVIFWRGEDFTIQEVNDAFLEMSGFSRDEAIGKSWRELTPEEFYPVSEQGVKDLKTTGQPEPYEKQYLRKDGSRWWGLCAPRRIDDNEVVEFLLDITDRKEAEQEREYLLKKVEAEKERLSDIFKQAPSFMCIQRGPDHTYERANDLYRQLLGNREFMGKPVREALPELEGQGYFELLDQVYETGEPFRGTDMKVELQHPNSEEEPEERYIDFVFQPLRGPDGEVNGIFTQGVDLTERHHAKEELKAMNETLEERVEQRTKTLRSYQKQLRSLASQLNKAEERERQRLATELHDKLGQMLTVAKMQVEGLQQDYFSDQTSSEVEDLKKVIDDTLKYNQNLMAELKPPPVLDKEDVTEVLRWTAKKLEKQGLNIDIQDDGKSKPVEKEIRSTLHQSVRELFLNVLKHAEVDEARMVISRRKDQVQITVEDKGKGFDREEKELAPTKDGGFGLFNIKERIDWHGGAFEIHSEPGKGTTAILSAPLKYKKKVEMPVQNYEEKSPASDKGDRQGELWQKIKVMLVDDHEMVRRGLRQMIEKQDDMTIVAEAADGEEAVKIAHDNSPDIVVMDVNMPVMDGIEATQKIKKDMPAVRIIGLSLHDSPEVIKDMQSAGASDYLTKDEAFETLCETIRNEAQKIAG